MTVRAGSCLCGARAYEIEGEIDAVWVCHCSRCRKASGSSGNSILIVPRDRFRWVRGEDHEVTFALPSGYSITRCRTCGAPLPAETDETNIYVTAGSLDTPLGRGVRTHLFCASRADWDRDEPDVRYFDERSR
ncbi:GFA family protein [Phenylobacterium sp.]|uniref:GFA family protein n=1 Tax=Phenylobacterium sp. TaxID=1871053 RepID=UPI002717474C|nr:GFA family protein [Phenylobacterium sp.]MDO8801398.1 GFA family protein [Phenylobacterium sp.]